MAETNAKRVSLQQFVMATSSVDANRPKHSSSRLLEIDFEEMGSRPQLGDGQRLICAIQGGRPRQFPGSVTQLLRVLPQHAGPIAQVANLSRLFAIKCGELLWSFVCLTTHGFAVAAWPNGNDGRDSSDTGSTLIDGLFLI